MRRDARPGADAISVATELFRQARDAARPGDVAVVDIGDARAAFVMTRTEKATVPVRIELDVPTPHRRHPAHTER